MSDQHESIDISPDDDGAVSEPDAGAEAADLLDDGDDGAIEPMDVAAAPAGPFAGADDEGG